MERKLVTVDYIASMALSEFKSLCNTTQLKIVNNVIKKHGGSEKYIKTLSELLLKNEIINNKQLNNQSRVSAGLYVIASKFQNAAVKNKNLIEKNINFAYPFEASFERFIGSLGNYVIDDSGKKIDVRQYFDSFNNNNNSNLDITNAGFVNEGFITSLILSTVIGFVAGKAITKTIKSSPKATAWVSNVCDSYPGVAKVVDFLTWTDLEEIREQHKINQEGRIMSTSDLENAMSQNDDIPISSLVSDSKNTARDAEYRYLNDTTGLFDDFKKYKTNFNDDYIEPDMAAE